MAETVRGFDVKDRTTGSLRGQLEFGTCVGCGSLFDPPTKVSKYCSNTCRNRARETRRMMSCAVCGELMHRSRTSLPEGEAKHRRCRAAVLVHGRASTYGKRGCRCNECRAAASAAVREWTRKNNYWSDPEVVERRRQARSSVEARDVGRARWARYYNENRPAMLAAAKAKEVRRKGAPTIPFTVKQLEDRLSMFAGCWMCGAEPDEGFHVDHVKPLARGGWHCLSNLRPACGPCNWSKGAKWPLDKVISTA